MKASINASSSVLKRWPRPIWNSSTTKAACRIAPNSWRRKPHQHLRNPNGRPVRTLVPGSTQVFILENNGVMYGAIQQGVHRFHTKGQDPQKNGYTEAKFSHVWILNKGQWQLKTALSFDHQQDCAPGAGKPLTVKAKKEPEPYTIYDLTLLGHSLRLDYRAMLD